MYQLARNCSWCNSTAVSPECLYKPPADAPIGELRTRTGNALWKAIHRSMGPAFAAKIPPQESADHSKMCDLVRRQAADPSGDFHRWKAIISGVGGGGGAHASDPERAGSDCGAVLEAGLIFMAQVESEVDDEDRSCGHEEEDGEGYEEKEEGSSTSRGNDGSEGESIDDVIKGRLDRLAAEAREELGRRHGDGRFRNPIGEANGRSESEHASERDTQTDTSSPVEEAGGRREDCIDACEVVAALNEVLFSRHAFRASPDLGLFPADPRDFLLGETLAVEHGDAAMLALVYVAVAARLGLGLQCLPSGGQRLLRSSAHDDRGPRNPSGRRCQTRNVWPLKRVDTQVTARVKSES